MILTLIYLSLAQIVFAPCPDADSRCLQCLGDICVTCINSFANSSGLCVSVRNLIDNCLSYESEGYCKKCQLGYHLDENQNCLSINIVNCVELDLNGECYKCKDGLIPIDGICSTQKCSIDHCSICVEYNENQ